MLLNSSGETLVPPPLTHGQSSRRPYARQASQSPSPSTFSTFTYASESVSRDRNERSRSTSRGGSRVRLIRDSLRGIKSESWEKETEILPVSVPVAPPVPVSLLSKLPPHVAHFLGKRTAGYQVQPLKFLSLPNQNYILSFIGSLVSILLVTAIAQGLSEGGFGGDSLPLALYACSIFKISTAR